MPKRIREVRGRLGLSQSQLGAALKLDPDVAVTRISQYELGVHTPIFSLIQRLAALAQVPEAYFYTADDDLAALIAVYGGLAPADRQRLLQLAEGLQETPGPE